MESQPEDQQQRQEAEETFYSLLAKQIYTNNRLREVTQALQTTDSPEAAEDYLNEIKELKWRLYDLKQATRFGL